MTLAQTVQALASVFTERMLNGSVVGVIIALFGLAMQRALRRRSSSTRFAVLFLTLLAVAVLPFIGYESAGAAARMATVSRSAIHLPESWALDIFIAWVLIAGIALGRIGFGLLQLRRLRRSCVAVDLTGVHGALGETLNELQAGRRVALCVSDQVRVPTAIGLWKPAVVLPAWAMEELTPLELNAVVLHELAHLRRWDDWTNLVHRLARALLFFHPAVWWIGRGLSLEREVACDEFVLAATSNPRAYAQCLVSVAEKSFLHRSFALAQAIVGRMQQTSQRVARILEGRYSGARVIWKPALGLVAAFSAFSVISLPRLPRLVVFEGKPASRIAQSLPAPAPIAPEVSHSTAKVIPAALHTRIVESALKKNSVARAMKPARPSEKRDLPAMAQAVREQASDTLVQASDVSSKEVSKPHAVWLVMQTQQINASGEITWSIRVWRWTVYHPEQQKTVAPKST